jgi:hypothetical protein
MILIIAQKRSAGRNGIRLRHKSRNRGGEDCRGRGSEERRVRDRVRGIVDREAESCRNPHTHSGRTAVFVDRARARRNAVDVDPRKAPCS